MKTRFLIGSGKAALIRTLCLCFGLLLLNLLPAPAFATTPTTEPADIAALRASQARSAADLRLQAIKLRDTIKDPKHRAWAALALAEFENDLENADAALAMLTQAYNEAENLKLDDLKFLSLNARSTILVNRGRSDETDSVLKEMKAMVDASGGARPEWQAQWLDQRGVLERKLGHFDVVYSWGVDALVPKAGDAGAVVASQPHSPTPLSASANEASARTHRVSRRSSGVGIGCGDLHWLR